MNGIRKDPIQTANETILVVPPILLTLCVSYTTAELKDIVGRHRFDSGHDAVQTLVQWPDNVRI